MSMGGTLFAALAAYSGCAAARAGLDRAGGRAKVPPLAPAAALGLLWTRRRRCPLGTGLILGGGLSNLRERLTEGRVRDYLQFPRAPRPLDRYVFNLADLCVFAGGALCVLRDRRGGKAAP